MFFLFIDIRTCVLISYLSKYISNHVDLYSVVDLFINHGFDSATVSYYNDD
jgi:hypothetical protein